MNSEAAPSRKILQLAGTSRGAASEAPTPLRYLYVDDAAELRELVGFAAELDHGVEVGVAASGAEGLMMLDDFRPDAVLLDVSMPGMDGAAVLRAIRNHPEHADTPVIFITARATAEEQERLLRLDVLGVIIKPFDPMTLSLDVRAMLSRQS